MSLCIGYVGNFGIPWTTENERAWSFNKLGHSVIKFQENETTMSDLGDFIIEGDLLLYSHTHDPSWEIEGLTDVFKAYKKAGIPTASVHLDVFAGLEREKDVGREAMWFAEHVFTADGSPEAAKLYDSKGINWHWLKPGVVERECFMAAPDRAKFPHDIVFVGSRHYHKEYPFRPKLVDWLKKTYGERFGHYGNDGIGVIRGTDLNTLYASAQVVVGDSCFGGRRRYWSDRIPETTGRGGFLIHPYKDENVPYMDHEGVAAYSDLDGLKNQIDFYLENESIREKMRQAGYEWTKEHATYTQRSQQMLEVMGLA